MTPVQIANAKELIKSLKMPAYELELSREEGLTFEPPKNKKQEVIPYEGRIFHPNYDLYLFLNKEKAVTDVSNIELIVKEKKQEGAPSKSFNSLPIWEEVIHYDTSIHHSVVDILPKHPWSLYAAAKTELVGKAPKNQVAGYPQWLVNDIDFRNISKKEFLFQMELPDNERTIYFFWDSIRLIAEIFVQKF
jgi:hypothetical protein